MSTAITVPAMARPMAMDHRRSTRALLAAACACSAVVVRRLVMVVCREARLHRGSPRRRLDGSQMRGLWRVRPAGQECTETRLRGDVGRHPVGQTGRQVGVARQREEVLQGRVGLVDGVLRRFRLRPHSWRTSARSCRRPPSRAPGKPPPPPASPVPAGGARGSAASVGQSSDSAWDALATPRKAPASAIRVSTTPSRTMARWGAYHLQGSRTFVSTRCSRCDISARSRLFMRRPEPVADPSP